MFVFLVTIGFTLIFFGYFKKKFNPYLEKFNYDNKELKNILERLDGIEKILFNTDIDVEQSTEVIGIDDFELVSKEIMNEKVNIQSEEILIDENETQMSSAVLGKYKKICELEKKNYSIDEISKHLNMNKGEVVLLKNLYKDY